MPARRWLWVRAACRRAACQNKTSFCLRKVGSQKIEVGAPGTKKELQPPTYDDELKALQRRQTSHGTQTTGLSPKCERDPYHGLQGVG